MSALMDVWINHDARTANMTEHPPSDLPLVDVGCFERLADARERALVVSAMELPYWVVRQGSGFVLQVEARDGAGVILELEKFEQEQTQRTQGLVPEKPLPKIETLSLYVAAWVMGTFWALQNWMPERWEESGEAVSAAIAKDGEWWRAATALMLHGDISHLVANMVFGLFFSAFVLPHFGTGVTWLAIVASGFLGNVANAYFYRGTPHISVGSSTAVFGALGILVAIEFAARWSAPATRSRWQLVLPIGGGFALLAFLGAGDETHSHTDYMAHLWGFGAGLAIGAIGVLARVRDQVSPAAQRVAAFGAPGIILVAWWLAYASAR